MTNSNPNYRSGFVSVIGRPNVGKSTLINRMIGMKIAAVSPWPQTTRRKQMGILTLDDAQIIFVDTPGIHKPLHKLGEWMNKEAEETLDDCDVICFLVDLSQSPDDDDRRISSSLARMKRKVPTLLVLNKLDLVPASTLEAQEQAYQNLLPGVQSIAISATRGDNVNMLLAMVKSHLPVHPPFFPEDQVTDLYEREIVADLIREAALFHLRAEVPHSLAVRIDEFKERQDGNTYIAATLFVERESQKPIVIGQGASMLKKIGISARQEIERMLNKNIYLDLRVKVRKNWRNDESALRLFGYKP